jgi:DNA-binding response OmpR family regulator
MTRSPRGRVVALSSESSLVELLDTLLADSNDYDVFVVESLPRGYSRIKQVRPDLIVLFMTIDDVPGCQLLSMLALDREVSGIPIVPFVTTPGSRLDEEVTTKVPRRSSREVLATHVH